MKRIIFLILTCFAVNINAQTPTEIFRNNEFKVNEYNENRQTICMIDNIDDDTIWVSYFDTTLENSKIISLDKNLNIISNTLINYPPSSGANLTYNKINDKFYTMFFTHVKEDTTQIYLRIILDTLQFRCFDRNGNTLVDKTLWVKNYEDTLWINTMDMFKYRRLSNGNFILVANATYPSNPEPYGTDALRLMLIDTLGNILNTKTYPLKANATDTRICEVGEHLLLEKLFYADSPNGYFGYYGISYINKETLEIEDSIPRGPFIDILPNGITVNCHTINNIGAINDTIFAGAFEGYNNFKINIYNKNTKEIICQIKPTTSINVDLSRNLDYYYDRFVFNNQDSIYMHYEDNKALTLLNFSADGNINFQYKIIFPSTYLQSNIVKGMKITEDGDVIINTSSYNYVSGKAAWLIKFNPKGLIGLTNLETGERETIKVYPNPAKDYINVDIDATNFDKGEIELFDMQGKFVKRAKLNAKQGNRVDVSNLNAGAYSYNVFLNGKTISGKVIVGK